MRTSWLLMFVLGSVVTGCDGCDDGGLPNGDGGGHVLDMAMPTDMSGEPGDGALVHKVSYAEFALHYAQATCAHALACGQLDQASMSICLERNTHKLGWDIDSEILKQRVELNEAVCIAAISSSRCDGSDFVAYSTACSNSVFIPHLQTNDVCLGDAECIDGYCKHSTVDGGTAPQATGCPGRCAPFEAANTVCSNDVQCGSDAVCDVPSDATDNVKHCLPLLAVGTPDCDTIYSQNGFLGCNQKNSYCPFFGTSPKSCVEAKTAAAIGDPCDLNAESAAAPPCPVGAYCQFNDAKTAGTCQPKITDGTTPCDNFAQDPAGRLNQYRNPCADGTFCYNLQDTQADKGTCQPFGGNMEPCVAFAATVFTCQQGYYCESGGVGTAGVCKPYLADGQPCSGSNLCASNEAQRTDTCIVAAGSSGGQRTCQPKKGFGESCVVTVENSLCLPSDAPGSSACLPAGNNGGVCAPKCL
jgi:hypothetical protein